MTACPPVVLTVAGSDPSGGAGLQADLRLFAAEGLYGTAVVAGITVQDSFGVRSAEPVAGTLLAAQLAAVLDDLPVAAAKSGMLGSADNVRAVAAVAGRLSWVLDPVLVSTSGHRLLAEEALDALITGLLPRCALVTHNLDEAAVLLGLAELAPEDAAEAARALVALGCRAAVVTGGHAPGAVLRDYAWIGGQGALVLEAPRIETPHSHGTGCLFSAAAAAALARGCDLEGALRHARWRVSAGLRAAVAPGRGRGAPWTLGSGSNPNGSTSEPAGVPGASSAPRRDR